MRMQRERPFFVSDGRSVGVLRKDKEMAETSPGGISIMNVERRAACGMT